MFLNASHGEIASNELLQKYFPKMSKQEIITLILDKGELQLSDKEREVHVHNLFNEVCKLVADKCVHPESGRPFGLEDIKAAIHDIQFTVRQDKPSKVQANDCIKKL